MNWLYPSARPERSTLRQVVIHGGVKRLLQFTLVVRLKRDDILGAEQPTVKNPIIRIEGDDRLVSLVFHGNAPGVPIHSGVDTNPISLEHTRHGGLPCWQKRVSARRWL